MQSEAVYRLGVSVDAGSGPGNLFVADPAMIVDNVDPLLPIVPQVVLLLEEVLLVDVFPKTGAEGLAAEDASPGTPVVPR